MELIISLSILTVGCIGLIVVAKKYTVSGKKGKISPVAGILVLTVTNNTYPPLLDVLSSLKSDLEKKGITLHADMKGYMRNGENQNR